MDKLIREESMSTDCTRTCTSWPTESSSSTLSTNPSLICETWTRPSAEAPLSSVTVTKAPKGAVLATTPLCHSSGETSRKGPRSAGLRGAESVKPSTMVRPYFPSSLFPEIQTSISCPSSTKSYTFSILSLDILEMCKSPSDSAPMSTKAPKSRTLRTVPLYFCPTSRASKAIGGYFMSFGWSVDSSGPPSGSSHLTVKVPSSLSFVTSARYQFSSSGNTASTASPTL
mmetsp:Transcript_36377/g.67720  ORF Transcript_36377/g.67720 Transcript_36377/m.67720 type:complete len:228 (-) Transcript_36377:423-1106(-)